jgi:hypothetical protein
MYLPCEGSLLRMRVDFHVSDEVSYILGRTNITSFYVHREYTDVYHGKRCVVHLTVQRFLFITLKSVINIKTLLSYRILNEFFVFQGTRIYM